jgi:hypothetical protein
MADQLGWAQRRRIERDRSLRLSAAGRWWCALPSMLATGTAQPPSGPWPGTRSPGRPAAASARGRTRASTARRRTARRSRLSPATAGRARGLVGQRAGGFGAAASPAHDGLSADPGRVLPPPGRRELDRRPPPASIGRSNLWPPPASAHRCCPLAPFRPSDRRAPGRGRPGLRGGRPAGRSPRHRSRRRGGGGGTRCGRGGRGCR